MQAALTDLRVSSRAETKTSSLRKATPPLVMGPGTFGCKGFVEFHAVLTCCIGGLGWPTVVHGPKAGSCTDPNRPQPWSCADQGEPEITLKKPKPKPLGFKVLGFKV